MASDPMLDVLRAAITSESMWLADNFIRTHGPALLARLEAMEKAVDLHIVFDGPPGPESGRFVECEDPDGHGVHAGEWEQRGDCWHLIVPKAIRARGQS